MLSGLSECTAASTWPRSLAISAATASTAFFCAACTRSLALLSSAICQVCHRQNRPPSTNKVPIAKGSRARRSIDPATPRPLLLKILAIPCPRTGCLVVLSAGMPARSATHSVDAGRAEPALAPLRRRALLYPLQPRLRYRHQQQLGDAIAHGNGVGLRAAVPARDHQRPLVIGIDDAH